MITNMSINTFLKTETLHERISTYTACPLIRDTYLVPSCELICTLQQVRFEVVMVWLFLNVPEGYQSYRRTSRIASYHTRRLAGGGDEDSKTVPPHSIYSILDWDQESGVATEVQGLSRKKTELISLTNCCCAKRQNTWRPLQINPFPI